MSADKAKCALDFTQWPISPSTSRRGRPMAEGEISRGTEGQTTHRLTDPDYFQEGISCCGLLFRCCYWFCPPCPNSMTNKIAFHPPPKGLFYKLYEYPAYHSNVEDLKDVEDGRRLGIRLLFPYPIKTHLRMVTENVEAFVIRNSRGNRLVGALYRPDKLLNSNEVILFSNPNSMDLGQNLFPSLAYIQRLGAICGMDVFSYDYSGYGYSEGRPSEKNLYSDIEAVYAKIQKLRPSQKIVLVGVSLGACPSAHMAALNPPNLAGLVMVAGFSSGLPIICGTRPSGSPSCLDHFCTVRKIPKIEVPILFIHGELDTLISVKHSELMHSLAKRPVHPLWICDANHQNIFLHCDVIPRINRFVSQELGPVVSQPSHTITISYSSRIRDDSNQEET